MRQYNIIFVLYILGPTACWCPMPLTSSLGEFPGHWDWLWYPGLSPVLVSFDFPFAFHISVFFHSLDCNRVSATIHSTLHFADGEFPGLGLALVSDIVVPVAEHRVCIKQKSRLKFLPWPGFEPRTLQFYGCSTMAHPLIILLGSSL